MVNNLGIQLKDLKYLKDNFIHLYNEKGKEILKGRGTDEQIANTIKYYLQEKTFDQFMAACKDECINPYSIKDILFPDSVEYYSFVPMIEKKDDYKKMEEVERARKTRDQDLADDRMLYKASRARMNAKAQFYGL